LDLQIDYPSNPIAEAWGDPLRITLINVLILPDTSEGYLGVSEIGGGLNLEVSKVVALCSSGGAPKR